MSDSKVISLSDFEGHNLQKSYTNNIEKGGEGSRGGKVIGHTKSGKPIYDHASHESHKSFTKEDHEDAVNAHHNYRIKHHNGSDDESKKKYGEHYDQMSSHQNEIDKRKHIELNNPGNNHQSKGQELSKQAEKAKAGDKVKLGKQADEHFNKHAESLSDNDLKDHHEKSSAGSREKSVYAAHLHKRANDKSSSEHGKNRSEGNKPKSTTIDNAKDELSKALDILDQSVELIEKAGTHKYLRREGTKGNYKYIYQDEKGNEIHLDKKESVKTNSYKREKFKSTPIAVGDVMLRPDHKPGNYNLIKIKSIENGIAKFSIVDTFNGRTDVLRENGGEFRINHLQFFKDQDERKNHEEKEDINEKVYIISKKIGIDKLKGGEPAKNINALDQVLTGLANSFNNVKDSSVGAMAGWSGTMRSSVSGQAISIDTNNVHRGGYYAGNTPYLIQIQIGGGLDLKDKKVAVKLAEKILSKYSLKEEGHSDSYVTKTDGTNWSSVMLTAPQKNNNYITQPSLSILNSIKSNNIEKSVTMSDKEFKSEHKKLIPTLREGSKEERNKEADEQEEELNEQIEKSSGEGSRGGRVIGHTKSGKAIYDSPNLNGVSKHIESFSKEDHKEAADVHHKIHKDYKEKSKSDNGTKGDNYKKKMDDLAEHHLMQHNYHKDKSTNSHYDKSNKEKLEYKHKPDSETHYAGKNNDSDDRHGDDSSKQYYDRSIKKALDILQTSVNVIEKASHKNHKYLRIENGRYIYDENQMTHEDHQAAFEHHVGESNKVNYNVHDPKNDPKFEEYKKHMELAGHHKDQAAKKNPKYQATKERLEQHKIAMAGGNKKNSFLEMRRKEKAKEERKNKKKESNKSSDIEKALSILDQSVEVIEKAAHKTHKYLRIENGKYIYDESKMTSKDHHQAAKYHEKEVDKMFSQGYSENADVKSVEKDIKYHKSLVSHHKKQAVQKEGSTITGKKENSDTIKMSLDQYKEQFKKELAKLKTNFTYNDTYEDLIKYFTEGKHYSELINEIKNKSNDKGIKKEDTDKNEKRKNSYDVKSKFEPFVKEMKSLGLNAKISMEPTKSFDRNNEYDLNRIIVQIGSKARDDKYVQKIQDVIEKIGLSPFSVEIMESYK